MYDRFTDRAHKMLGLARQEAQRLDQDFIGPEHMLLGLAQEGKGVGAAALTKLEVDLEKIRHEVEQLVTKGTTTLTPDALPFTPGAKKVLELSVEESRSLGHDHVGTAHLLLGLIREDEGTAAQVLRGQGVKLEEVRKLTGLPPLD